MEKKDYSIEELKEICLKKNYNAFYLDLFPRRVGIHLVKLLLNTSVTPNHISTATLILGLISCFLFALGEYKYLLLGGILYPFVKVLDCTDGNLARARGTSSDFGKWYEGIIDELISSLTYLSISYGIFSVTNNPFILLVGLVGLVGHHNITFANLYWISIFEKEKRKEELNGKETSKGWRKILPLFRPDPAFYYLLIGIGAILNQLFFILLFLAIFTNLVWTIKILLGIKRKYLIK